MIWLDWLIIAAVAALAAVIYKQWKDRPRLINKLDSPVRRAGPAAAARDDRERNRRPPEALRQVPANRRFSTGTHAFACYKHKFEEMTKGRGDEEASFWETISALAFEVRATSPHGLEHFQGVSRLASQIALQLGLSDAEVEEIRVAGIVHDIGKTHVPEQLRLKPDVLTAEEFEIMKNHAVWGARMLEPLNEQGIEQIVRHHHERFDGNGYPDQLKGEEIPLGARIVSVAECFDSMVSEQAYKDSRSFEDAVAEVLRCSGTQFDPEVVAAFLGRVRMEGDLHRQN
jgi:putative nucleotidyltransferase with HDIG domain